VTVCSCVQCVGTAPERNSSHSIILNFRSISPIISGRRNADLRRDAEFFADRVQNQTDVAHGGIPART
jgi:hypothetical protein